MQHRAHMAHDTGAFSQVLLGRGTNVVHGERAGRLLQGRRVLVTGAAGSIGSELARQATDLGADVYLLDYDESRLHALKLQLTGNGLLDDASVVLARHPRRSTCPPGHARDPSAGRVPCRCSQAPPAARALSIPKGSRPMSPAPPIWLQAAVEVGVDRFILISTDKAADPSSVLGATKLLAEQIVLACSGLGTRFASVRFGNVLASRGSLLDTIRHQVLNDLPVSITDPEVERYFMTIPEAVGLVIEASAMAQRGETYVLEMGTPVKIVDIVERFAGSWGHRFQRSPSSVCVTARS